MKTITLKSGNTFEIQQADFQSSWALTQEVASVIGSNLSGLGLTQSTLSNLENDIDVGIIIGIVLKLVSSPTIYPLIWPCFKPCLYNSMQVTRETFNSEESRQDFLPCVQELLKENVFPFMKGLSLKF